jgi:hypothetical protein
MVHPPTQTLSTIIEGSGHPTFGNIPKPHQHQPATMSTTAAGSSQNGSCASSTQTNGGNPRQSPSRALSPVQGLQGDAKFDQIQVQDWDEEAEEDKAAMEEELTRVQKEIEWLWQEQETIMRRQAIAQRTEAHRQHINRECVRLVELQYTIDILHQHQHNANSPPPPPPHNYTHPPPPPFDNIPYHQPPSLLNNQFFQPPPPQLGTTNPKCLLTNHLQLAPWPTNYRATPPPKYHGNTDPRKFLMCYEAAIASAGGNETPSPIPSSILSRMPQQTGTPGSPRVHLLLATSQKKVPTQFPGVPSRARYRRRFPVLRSARKRNTPQNLPEVFTAEIPGSGGIRQPSHHSGQQSFTGGAVAQPPHQRAAQNSATAL